MNILSKLSLFALISALFISCGDDDDDTTPEDNQAPVIESASIEPAHGDEIKQGEYAHIEYHFTDNQALAEARIDIHWAGDGHSHKLAHGDEVEFKWDTIIQLSGTEEEGHFDVKIPYNAKVDPYHLTVEVVDEAGNKPDNFYQDFNIYAGDDSPTEFNITSPDLDVETEVDACDHLHVEGSITDEDGIDEIHIKIVEEGHGHDHHHHKLANGYVYDNHIHVHGETTYTFEDYEIEIPCDTPEGHYEIIFEVEDMEGHKREISGELHIHEEGEHHDH